MSESIGIRLNNPGNIEWGSPWQGLIPREQSMYYHSGNKQQRRFAQFKDPISGIRAIAVTLITYQDKRRAKDGSKIDSVQEIIDRWAPPVENNTSAYAKAVAVALGKAPDDETVNVHDYATIKAIVEAIIRHENGQGPLKTPNTWYTSAQIDEGLRRAGVTAPVKAPIAEVTTATASAAMGADQLAEALPPVVHAIQGAQDQLSSGQVVQVVIGLVLVGAAVFIAYNRIRKGQLGLL